MEVLHVTNYWKPGITVVGLCKRFDFTLICLTNFVTAEQRKRDDFGITEDDVMEIRQDISTLRYELIDILHQNGMRTPNLKPNENASKCVCMGDEGESKEESNGGEELIVNVTLSRLQLPARRGA